jgi:hypothetical protein
MCPRPQASASFLVCVLLLVSRGAAAQSTTEVVLEWNRILQTSLMVPGALPPTVFFTRPYAVLQVAVFDAVNSIDGTHTPYAVRIDGTGASPEVAAAQAAHDVMVAMFPPQTATFDAALATTLARSSGEALARGVRVGAEVARVVLELRANDGWNRPAQTYILPELPGYWQPVPPQNAAATLVHYQDVEPFVIGHRLHFLPEAPPSITSQHYADDFNEVKALGSVNSTTRTADQTQTARRWASVGFSTTAPGVWYNVGRDLARARGLSGIETARLFALLGMTHHDALLTSFTGKFTYGLWRPTTAIREAASDGNAATTPDAEWVSLIGTPPYPAYPGNMACIGASSSALFAQFWGQNDIPFAVTWAGISQADVTRSYNGFRELADEEARSRIYAGIHFTFDHTASFGACTQVGEYAFANSLRPRTVE